MCDEKPTRTALGHIMHSVATHGLRDFREEYLRVKAYVSVQSSVAVCLFFENLNRQPISFARHLPKRSFKTSVCSEKNRQTDHPFITNRGNLTFGSIFQDIQNRSDGSFWKIHISKWLVRFVKRITRNRIYSGQLTSNPPLIR